MLNKSCMNWIGDDDCNKCAARGFIYLCPDPCPDYIGFYPHDKHGPGRPPKEE